MSNLIKAMLENDINKVERIMTMYTIGITNKKTFYRLKRNGWMNDIKSIIPVIYLEKDVRVKDMPKVINFELTKLGRYLQRVNESV